MTENGRRNILNHFIVLAALFASATVLPAQQQQREQIINSIIKGPAQQAPQKKAELAPDKKTAAPAAASPPAAATATPSAAAVTPPQQDANTAGDSAAEDRAGEEKATADRAKKKLDTKSPSADEVLYKTGIELYNSEYYEAALKSFGELKSKFPESSFGKNAAIWSGKTNLQMRKYSEAVTEFTAVNPESGEYPASLYYLGETYRRMGQKVESINTFYRLSAQYPKYELADDALIRLGEIYLADKKGDLALNAATKVIRNYSDRNTIDEAYYLIGRIYEKDPTLKDMETSRKFYRLFIQKASASEPHFRDSPLLRRVKNDLKRLESTYFRHERQ